MQVFINHRSETEFFLKLNSHFTGKMNQIVRHRRKTCTVALRSKTLLLSIPLLRIVDLLLKKIKINKYRFD